MTDPVSPRDRGWQNVARRIKDALVVYRVRPNETPLTDVEAAEVEAWQVAHMAVIDGLVRRSEVDGD